MIDTVIAIKFENPDFGRRVTAATILAARTIFTENANTPGHEDRLILAEAVLRDPVEIANRVSWLVATDPAVIEAAQLGGPLGDDLIRAAVDRAITAHAGPLVA